MIKILILLILYSSLFSTVALAHSNIETQKANYLIASTALSYRSDEVALENQAYLIPGALLGGEALPFNQGAGLDEGQLAMGYATADNYYVSAVVNAHEHNGSHEIELEKFWLTTRYLQTDVADFWLDIGKLSTQTTKSASWHTSQDRFADPSLISDVFWGRHFNDSGIRSELKSDYAQLGIELWNGDAWPASKNEGAYSIYIKTQPTWLGKNGELGIWGIKSEASNRSDLRYNQGHNHGTNITNIASEYTFTGNTEMIGSYIFASLTLADILFLSELEWIQSDSTGVLSINSQSAVYNNQYSGIRFLMGAQYKSHQFFIQHEELTLKNHFYGDITDNFIIGASLLNNGFEPNRTIYAWQWKITSDLNIKTEFINLQHEKNDQENKYVVVSLVWNHAFEVF
ncbi:hypothetical protein [Aliikangiella maris]|uniref:Uncharacterized protein n=2 Tax=Aliikangiella maris TaxID=3162458 RepID=A0ABV3MN08_9GAMM